MAVKVMTARRADTCATCGKAIAAGERINYGGRDAVTHAACQAVARVRVGRYGSRVYRGQSATGRRCEDAPCCGCCD
jgi:hypothetical protein